MEPRDRESPIVNFVQLFLRMSVMLNMLYRKREREREREKSRTSKESVAYRKRKHIAEVELV